MVSRANLESLYWEKGKVTWEREDFNIANLESSRKFYTSESLLNRRPEPVMVDVYALLSGVPFSDFLINEIAKIQAEIAKILGTSLHYQVESQNLGIEYCVFKWPDSPWFEDWIADALHAVTDAVAESPYLEFSSFQINPDGCIVLKGFDISGHFFALRRNVCAKLHFLPNRQSQWAHIPLEGFWNQLDRGRSVNCSSYRSPSNSNAVSS